MSHKCPSVLSDANGRPLAEIASVSADFEDGQVIPEHSHPLPSGRPAALRFRRGDDPVDQAGRFGSAAAARGLDSREHPALGGHVGAGFHENSVLPAEALSSVSWEMFGHECIGAAEGANSLCLQSLCLQDQEIAEENCGERRIVGIIVEQLKSVESVPLQLPHPSDSRAMRVVRTLLADPADQRTLEKLCEDCGASKRTIQRVFLEETRMNFGRWRQQLPLLHALQLLASGEKVTAAAAKH